MKQLVIILFITLIASISLNITFIKKFNDEKEANKVDSSLAIMIYDVDTKDYIRTNDIPVGAYRLNEDKTYCVGRSEITNYDFVEGTVTYDTEAADECYLYFDALTGALKTILELYKGQGTQVGNGYLYYHDSTLANGAEDESYRFAGKNPNNYVCFEGDDCTDEDNLYRIIGIFGDNIKLIKYTTIGGISWNNNSSSNVWSTSYMSNYLSNTWFKEMGKSDYLIDAIWNVGGISYSNVSGTTNVKTTFDLEMNPSITSTQKIGLMYVSDYGYAALPNYWTLPLTSYSKNNNNWLLTSYNYEYTITPCTDNNRYKGAFLVVDSGIVGPSSSVTDGAHVRPTFYLKDTIKIQKGTGALDDPYILCL